MKKLLLAFLLTLLPVLALANDSNYYFTNCTGGVDMCNQSAPCRHCYGNPPTCLDIACANICASGATPGTVGDPWCLDPEQSGTNTSVASLMDGVMGHVPEFLPGDTAWLCVGACDGSGVGTFNVAATASRTWLRPTVVGTAGHVISIKAYPGEDVTISCDTNGDGVYQSGGDCDTFFD